VDSTGVRTPDMTADGSFSYTWDAESEMKAAAGVTYAYDAPFASRMNLRDGLGTRAFPLAAAAGCVKNESHVNTPPQSGGNGCPSRLRIFRTA
jgi:hypothetical protein